MGQRRLAPAELTDEELLKLIEGANSNKHSPIKNASLHDDILKFIMEHDLKQGEHKVLLDALYKLYAVGKDAPATLLPFTKVICLCFDHERANGSTFVYVDKDFMQVQRMLMGRHAPNKRRKRKFLEYDHNKKHVEDFFFDHDMLNPDKTKTWVMFDMIFGAYVTWVKNKKSTKTPLKENAMKKVLASYFKKKFDWKRKMWFEMAPMVMSYGNVVKDGTDAKAEEDTQSKDSGKEEA